MFACELFEDTINTDCVWNQAIAQHGCCAKALGATGAWRRSDTLGWGINAGRRTESTHKNTV